MGSDSAAIKMKLNFWPRAKWLYGSNQCHSMPPLIKSLSCSSLLRLTLNTLWQVFKILPPPSKNFNWKWSHLTCLTQEVKSSKWVPQHWMKLFTSLWLRTLRKIPNQRHQNQTIAWELKQSLRQTKIKKNPVSVKTTTLAVYQELIASLSCRTDDQGLTLCENLTGEYCTFDNAKSMMTCSADKPSL